MDKPELAGSWANHVALFTRGMSSFTFEAPLNAITLAALETGVDVCVQVTARVKNRHMSIFTGNRNHSVDVFI